MLSTCIRSLAQAYDLDNDCERMSPRTLESDDEDLLVVAVLLLDDVLHFLLHKLNTRPDTVDS